jgi:hypothetical protein
MAVGPDNADAMPVHPAPEFLHFIGRALGRVICEMVGEVGVDFGTHTAELMSHMRKAQREQPSTPKSTHVESLHSAVHSH